MSTLDGIRARSEDYACVHPERHTTCSAGDRAKLLSALDSVERLARYWETLADGDRYYARRIREAIAEAVA